MQEHENSLYSLLIIGALIAIGNVLTSNDPITPRLFAGRVIPAVWFQWWPGGADSDPGCQPAGHSRAGAALGIAGYQAVEVWLRRRSGKAEREQDK
ncbi:holin [Escherichia coli]|nr:holin [Escherichia coli]